MLKQKNRFHSRNNVRGILRHGAKSSGGPLRLVYQAGRGEESRVAVVVSKKVSKSAVKRNRIRRRVFELMRENWPAFDHPFDAVIQVFDEAAATMKSSELGDALNRATRPIQKSNK